MKSVNQSILNNRGQAGGNLVMILSAVNIVITLAMVAVLFISFQREKSRQTAEDIALRASEGDGKDKGHGEGKEGEHTETKKKILKWLKLTSLWMKSQYLLNQEK